ncbi:MAG: HAD-IIA family hydrolase [candidate division WOR-3 bacterium]
MVRIKGFLIDLDGTLYLERFLIPGSKELLMELEKRNIPYLLLTNNSTRTPQQVAEKLKNMGIEVTSKRIYTSANALGDYLRDHYTGTHRAYVIGEDGILEELTNLGWEIVNSHKEAEFVIVGLDRKVDYDKLTKAVLAIQNGAKFIACNADSSFPTPEGLLPGAGAIVSAIRTVVRKDPLILGKPNEYIVKYATKRMGLEIKETAIVGDRVDTDILLGKRMGMVTVLVMTGVQKSEEEIEKASPDFIFSDVSELWKNISKLL